MAHVVGTHRPDCHCVVREDYRRTREEFDRSRLALARREGVPPAVAHSELGIRQWVSDELRTRAEHLAAARRAEGRAWLEVLGIHVLKAMWALIAVLLLVQSITAIGAGWSQARSAGLVAAAVMGTGLSVLGLWAKRGGGILAPVRGLDGRLSTSKGIVGLWALVAGYVFVFLGMRVAFASGADERDALFDDLGDIAADHIVLVAVPFLTAVLARRIVGDKVNRRVLQKLRGDRARLRDFVADDAGRASLIDAQYGLVNLVCAGFVGVALARDPDRLPQVPATLVALAVVSAVTYLVAKLAETDKPVVLSIVRVRVPGDLDQAVRQGDDVEVRGLHLAAGGSTEPDLLGRVVVKFGAVHVHAPLVPTETGFANPSDTVVVVPVPVEVDPGRVEVRVVTAAGVESNVYEIEIAD